MPTNAHKRDENEVISGVRRRLARRHHWLRHGAPTLGGQLARVGVLGWIIVVPTLLGAWLGHFLDRAGGGGIFWSGSLMAAGIGLGCWSAWKWVHSQ